MLKKTILIFIIIFSFQKSYSQGVLDSIANKTCICIDSAKTLNMNRNQQLTEFGVCMIKNAEPYKKELKRDYNIDLNVLNKETGEKLGRLLALKLVGNCPSFKELMQNEISNQIDKKEKELVFKGTVKEIKQNQFYTIIVEDENKKIKEFLWLTEINENNISILKSKGENVKIIYIQMELFEPKLNKYVISYVLKSISLE
jgi:hypothetical protein